MIVAHSIGAVFVKTRKVAGTSVEIVLSTACSSEDVITPTSNEDIRRQVGGLPPQNYLASGGDLVRPRYLYKALRDRSRPRKFHNHMTAKAGRRIIGTDAWEQYLTFTIDRNPWDKAVSFYYYSLRRSKYSDLDFSSWLARIQPDKLSNFGMYSDNDTVIVDRVLRYENLSEELDQVWNELEIQVPELPRAKGTFRPNRARDWRSMYSDEDAEYVATICAREIGLLGYTFDGDR